METRPPLSREISAKDFKDFYWLKKELQEFCKKEGLRQSGSKVEIANRILHYLTTGKSPQVVNKKLAKRSTFDWSTGALSPSTIITDNYKNSENVRSFFTEQIGKPFKFNVKFMNWMKANQGKTLGDAIVAWRKIKQEKKARIAPKEIAPQFEYNRYLRDFLADNPGKSRKEGIELWKIKRSLRGPNEYEQSDLNLLKK